MSLVSQPFSVACGPSKGGNEPGELTPPGLDGLDAVLGRRRGDISLGDMPGESKPCLFQIGK